MRKEGKCIGKGGSVKHEMGTQVGDRGKKGKGQKTN